jgi:RNA polymerase sigma factor (sigma-70 family)
MEPGPVHAVLQQLRKLATIEAMSEVSDGQLLLRYLANREEAAFAALLHRHGAMVWRVCHRILRHRQNAEDVFQATFLTLARKAASIRKATSVASWLHGVSYHLARQLQAELARQRRGDARPAAKDPAETASANELQAVLDEELAQLAERYRTPLVLCYLEGLTRDEAAVQLGVSLSTFKRRLDRARRLLAARLTRRGLSLGVAFWTGGVLQDTFALAVPPTVTSSTCHAVMLLAAGQPLTGIISPRVSALTDRMVQATMTTRLQRVAALLLAVVLLAAGAGLWAGHERPATESPAPPEFTQDKTPARIQPKEDVAVLQDVAAFVKRGDYLVNQVARCGDCHTPRNSKGELDLSRHLQGAPTWFTPKTKFKRELAERAPDITATGRAGKWSEDKMVKFLSNAEKVNPPMPAYNLAVEDAQAVTAYLRSLSGKKKEGNGKSKGED